MLDFACVCLLDQTPSDAQRKSYFILTIADCTYLKLKLMKTKKMSLKNVQDVLTRDEMKKIMAGSSLSYCAESYMIRSCNNLSSGALSGWSYGWGTAGCSQYNGSQLYGTATSMGYNMTGCSTGWYSY